MATRVGIYGRGLSWPDRCVGCNSTRRLITHPLTLHVRDGAVSDREMDSTIPAQSSVTWDYPICKRCANFPRKESSAIQNVNWASVILLVITLLAVLLGDANRLWLVGSLALTVTQMTLKYFYNRSWRKHEESLPKRNSSGAFVSCIQVLDTDSREIRGFDNFNRLLSQGDVIIEFEFCNNDYAGIFRSSNRVAEKLTPPHGRRTRALSR